MLLSKPLSRSAPVNITSQEDIGIETSLSTMVQNANDPPDINPNVSKSRPSGIAVKVIFFLILVLGLTTPVKAQIDPTLASMIMAYTSKAEGALRSQQKVMATQSPAFILTTDQINQTVELQRQYNEYLESFRSIVVYGAQIYGFYQQITHMINTFKDFLSQLAKTPDNAFALALSSNSSNIYLQLITQSIDICNDIRKICFSNIKMTEVDRLEIVFQIRPKLRTMTKQLRNLTLAVKYTTFSRLWKSFDLDNHQFELDKNSISRGAFRRWRDNIK